MDAPVITNWHSDTFPRFHGSNNEAIFAFSEALAASVHLIVIVVQLLLCYYCNYTLENSFDQKEELSRRLNPLYRIEALLFVPALSLWLASGHLLGIWVLLPSIAIRILWWRKQRIGIDLRAAEPLPDTAFRTILVMLTHILSSFLVGSRYSCAQGPTH